MWSVGIVVKCKKCETEFDVICNEKQKAVFCPYCGKKLKTFKDRLKEKVIKKVKEF